MHPTGLYPEQDPARHRHPQATLYASLELSRSVWLVTSLAPGGGKMSKHSVAAGDGAALLALLARLRGRVERSAGGPVGVVVIQEAGMDGFWVHRLLEAEGMESRVVDPGSVAAPRRQRRAKTDAIDGETLLRTLLAWRRGEPRGGAVGARAGRAGGGSRGSARWCGRRARRRRIAGARRASAARCSRSGSGTPTGSKACSRRRGSTTSSRSARTAGPGSRP